MAETRFRRAPSKKTASTTSQRRTLRPTQKRVLPHLARKMDEELASAPENGIAPDGPAALIPTFFC
jgi:hypothetical protein